MYKFINVQMYKCVNVQMFTVHVIKRISKIPYDEKKIES
jgi:hypothetical protein